MKSKKRLICIATPLALCIIYMLFCLPSLRDSLNQNEAFSAYFIRGDITEIWRIALKSGYSPLFYTILKIWSLIFGNTDISLRFMSIFFGAIAIIFAFHLLKRWSDIKIAALGTALLALSPIFVNSGSKIGRSTIFIAFAILVIYVITIKLQRSSFFKRSLKLGSAITPIFAIAILAEAITSGAMNFNNNRKSGSYIKDTVSIVSQLAEKKEPILANNLQNYYESIFYSTSEHPIYVLYDRLDPEDNSAKPAETYRYNIIENPDTFISEHSRFWYITDLVENETKSPLAGYHIINEASNGHHLALELEKEV